MKKLFVMVLLLSPLSVSGEVPATIQGGADPTAAPWWVAEQLAVAEGGLVAQWFDEEERLQLESLIATQRKSAASTAGSDAAAQRPTCDIDELIFADYYQSQPSNEQLLRQSKVLVRGVVTDRRTGFYRGSPSNIFEIAVERYIVWPEDIGRPATLFARYGRAQVKVEGLSLCYSISGADDTPEVGDSVIVGTSDRIGGAAAPKVDGTYLISPLPQEVIIRRSGSTTAHWAGRSVDWEETSSRFTHGPGERD